MPDAPATPPPARYDELRAVFVNCTLKPSSTGEASHTERLIERARAAMRAQGVTVETIRAADMLVLASPIWLGERSSVCTRVVERLPQAEAGWIGEAGRRPSYGDRREGGGPPVGCPPVGFDNAFTQRNTDFMTWNLLHMARMLKDASGIPAHGNVRAEWDARHGVDEEA